MRPELYARVRRELLPGLQSICLSGTGEPFLAPILYQMLDDMLSAGKRVTIVTNGTIIRPDYLERLVRAPTTVVVSMDGTNTETTEYLRGIAMDRYLEFLKTLRDIAVREAHPDFSLQLRFIVTRSNLDQMAHCVELAHRWGASHVQFGNFQTYSRTDEFARHESLMGQPEEVMPHWERARRRGVELGVAVWPMVFDCKNRSAEEWRQHKSDLFDGDRIRQCPLPWWSVYVDVDGSVKPCCIFFPPVGNLLDQPFREIWNGPAFRALRRTVNTPNMPAVCRHCFMQERF